MPVYVSQPGKRVFSREAIDQLPVVTGLHALKEVRLRDSVRHAQTRVVFGALHEVLPGPLSLS